MIFTRSIGKVLRGKATPLQLTLACLLGAAIGFLPGYADGAVFLSAPGLLITLVLLLIILNANLALAAMVGGLAKLLSLALMPVSFEIGRILLDGPTSTLFARAINAPVLALFGLEYYAITGGLVLGLVIGAAAAVVVVRAVRIFRTKMAALEEGSEAYRKYAAKGWVKVLTFVLIGGNKGKRTYAELSAKRYGLPIRPLGVVFAGLVVALGFLINAMLRDEIVTAMLRRGLESANGATVDIGSARLDLRSGSLMVTGLAMADPQRLETDLFRAATVQADVSARDLLRKRIALDLVVAGDASTGQQRAIQGHRTRPAPAPSPAPRQPGDKTIDDYLAQAEVWKERLAQVRRWLEEFQSGEDPSGEPGQRTETLRERLAREVREKGYARVAAVHLIEGAPTVYVRQLQIDGLRGASLPGKTEPEILDIRAEHLSTHPRLVPETPKISVRSRSEQLSIDALLSGFTSRGGDSTLALACTGLPAESLGDLLKMTEPRPLNGGTIDLRTDGILRPGAIIDLPLGITIRNTTIAVPKLGSAPITELVVPVGVNGPIDDPRVRWDQAAFADALRRAGADELAGKLRAQAEQHLDKAKDRLGQEAGERAAELKERAAQSLGDRLPGLLPGLGDPKKEDPADPGDGGDEKSAEPAEKPAENIGEEIRKNLPGRLFPRRDDPKK